MEPRIQYATAADGVKIAYWTMGEGLALVSDWGLYSDLQLEWRVPIWREQAQERAGKRRYVRFNHRGCGLSDRDVTNLSLEAWVSDLEAVADQLSLDTFALYGEDEAGPPAVAYAARHPERVSHLILWGAWARAPEPALYALRTLREGDWDEYLESHFRIRMGWPGRDVARGLIDHYGACVTPEIGRAALSAIEQFDVSRLLARIQCPTLVIDHISRPFRRMECAREVAAGIRGAELLLIEEDVLDLTGWGKVEAAIDKFLAEDVRARPDGLTPREVAVLRLIAAGYTSREIGQELVLSLRTVARHISNIYRKTGARGKADATAYALRRQIAAQTSVSPR